MKWSNKLKSWQRSGSSSASEDSPTGSKFRRYYSDAESSPSLLIGYLYTNIRRSLHLYADWDGI
eukprot:254191-Hanusia_phi.AAC.1